MQKNSMIPVERSDYASQERSIFLASGESGGIVRASVVYGQEVLSETTRHQVQLLKAISPSHYFSVNREPLLSTEYSSLILQEERQ